MWSANLVLQSEPKRLQHFYLFEKNQESYKQIIRLKQQHQDRDVQIYRGDFNVRFHELLNSGVIKDKEATFCLLDQRTFECQWITQLCNDTIRA